MPKSAAQISRHRRQSVAGGKALAALDMCSEVAVAEIEPGRAAEPSERRHEIPGFVDEPPAACRIVLAG